MYKIRQIKYAKNSTSIQVYKIENRKRIIVRHIGTACNEEDNKDLLALANDFIEKASKQLGLFNNDSANTILNISQTEFIGIRYNFLYELISKILSTIGLDKINNQLLIDLVIIRMIEPASKLRSTSTSIKKFIHEGKKITDARLKNKITGKEHLIRASLTSELIKILSDLNVLT